MVDAFDRRTRGRQWKSLPKHCRNQLVKRWQCEVAFRRKQALEEKMHALQVEMDSKIQDCRKSWTSVIKRRRVLACILWFLGLVCFLNIARKFVSLNALPLAILTAYQTCHKLMAWALSLLVPVALCHELVCKQKNSGGQSLSRRFRFFLLVCSFIAGQLTMHAWHFIIEVLSVPLAACCVLAMVSTAAVTTAACLAASAYLTLRSARSFTEEFSAVEQRDREEASIYQSYQAEIRKCRLGLGLPPDEKSISNCSIL
eukprot:Skav230739  [mRNA]  locus=scaffold3436:23340:24110:+ [translate_table: standard]